MQAGIEIVIAGALTAVGVIVAGASALAHAILSESIRCPTKKVRLEEAVNRVNETPVSAHII